MGEGRGGGEVGRGEGAAESLGAAEHFFKNFESLLK